MHAKVDICELYRLQCYQNPTLYNWQPPKMGFEAVSHPFMV